MKKALLIGVALLFAFSGIAMAAEVNTYSVTARVTPYIMTGSVYPIDLGDVVGPSFSKPHLGPGATQAAINLAGGPAGTISLEGYIMAMAYANCPLTVTLASSKLSRLETGESAIGTDELNTTFDFAVAVNDDAWCLNQTSPSPLTFPINEAPHDGQVAAYLAVGVDGPAAAINPGQDAGLSPDAGPYTATFTVTYTGI